MMEIAQYRLVKNGLEEYFIEARSAVFPRNWFWWERRIFQTAEEAEQYFRDYFAKKYLQENKTVIKELIP